MNSREGSPIEHEQAIDKPSKPPKRTKITYGRARNSPKPSPIKNTPTVAGSQTIVPTTTDDEEAESDSDAMKIEYDWKKKLRELDDVESPSMAATLSVHQPISLTPGSSQGTVTRTSESTPDHGSPQAILSPVAPSPHPTADSPVISLPRKPRPTRRVDSESDSDLGVADRSIDSIISSTSQRTPVPASSPPSEDEEDDTDDMPTSILPESLKNKPVAVTSPTLSSSESEDEAKEPSPPSSRSKRTTRARDSQAKRKIKAPTKKERMEMVKDRARIADSRDIRIERTNRSVFTINELASRIGKTAEATSLQEPSSEDIDQFTSPVRGQKDANSSFNIETSAPRPFGAPALLTSQPRPQFPLSPSKHSRVQPDGGSDDELLDVASLRKSQQISGEEEKVKKLRQLRENKLRLVAQRAQIQAAARTANDDDDLFVTPSSTGSSKLLSMRQTPMEKGLPSRLSGNKYEHTPMQRKHPRPMVQNTHAAINKSSISLVQAQAIESREKRKAEFLSYGGRLKSNEEPAKSLDQVEQELAKNYCERVESVGEVYFGDEDEDDEDEDDEDEDEDFNPDDKESLAMLRGSASPQPDPEDGQADGLVVESLLTKFSESNETEEENKENSQPRPRRRPLKSLVVSDSDEEVQGKPLAFSSPLKKHVPMIDLQTPSVTQSQSLVPIQPEGPLEFSQDDEKDFGTEPPLIMVQAGLGDLFDPTQPQFRLRPEDNNDPFTQSEQSDTKDSGLVQTLTLGATPTKPALEIDQDLIRKADDIFGREQEAVVQAATRQPKQPDLYVNDYGFLTQTRPNEDAEIYQIPTSQHPSSQQTELPAHSPQRHPLQPIGPSSPAFTQTPLRRLRRRSSTPTPNPSPVKRLFIAPSPNEKRQRNKQPFDKSEFIADEANESDDDEIMGFGLGPDNRHEGDPEEEGVELDRHDERLVNDAFMDEATLAEQRVKDKAREHEVEDDQKLEELHKAAVEGKLREKRRNRGLDLDDGSESEEDQRSVWHRRNKHKRRRTDDTLDNLAQDPEKAAFLAEYQKSIDDDPVEDDIFRNLIPEDLMRAEEATVANEDEADRLQFVTATDLRREIQERLAEKAEAEIINPNDVSWIDRDASDDDDKLQIRTVIRDEGVAQLDDNEIFSRSGTETEFQKRKAQTWAKSINRNNSNASSGRLAGGAAVTGHKNKIRSGGGSLLNNGVSSAAVRTSKPLHPVPSLLSKVADRAAAFQS